MSAQFPALTCFHPGCVRVELRHCPALGFLWSCSGLAFLFWLLLKGTLGEDQPLCPCPSVRPALTWTFCPWEVFERWCCCHPAAATSCWRPQGHPCAGKCHSRSPARQDWPLQQLFWFPSPPFARLKLPEFLSVPSLLLPLHSGLAAGSRTCLPPAPRSV